MNTETSEDMIAHLRAAKGHDSVTERNRHTGREAIPWRAIAERVRELDVSGDGDSDLEELPGIREATHPHGERS